MRSRKKGVSLLTFLLATSLFTGISFLSLTLRSSLDDSPQLPVTSSSYRQNDVVDTHSDSENSGRYGNGNNSPRPRPRPPPPPTPVGSPPNLAARANKSCATVEEMGEALKKGFWKESLRVRKLIQRHFDVNGADRVRSLPPEQFCSQGFVLGKSSEAGFGNEMYKILTGAALSVMLNRSLIIGQTRHIGSFSSLSVSAS